ncbi:hypothetical protein KSP40_PGU020258 [Platanthera guangdongensis]|uniref:Uncharacterized protein n=1 Tax=Platanthera guangdongensis TaxID=2320717 RepID=A0ABR2LBJ4_9ASPA
MRGSGRDSEVLRRANFPVYSLGSGTPHVVGCLLSRAWWETFFGLLLVLVRRLL